MSCPLHSNDLSCSGCEKTASVVRQAAFKSMLEHIITLNKDHNAARASANTREYTQQMIEALT
jgi:hypothetical protein